MDFIKLFLAGSVAASIAIPVAASPPRGIGPGHMRIVSVAGAGPVKTERSHFDVNGKKLATSVGCNQIVGPITMKGSSVAIGPLITTKRACVPKLADLEQAYLAALGRVSAYKPRGSGIDLLDASGNVLVSLERAGGTPR